MADRASIARSFPSLAGTCDVVWGEACWAWPMLVLDPEKAV